MTDTDDQAWAATIAQGEVSTAPATTPYTPPQPAADKGDGNAGPRRALAVFAAVTVTAGAVLVGLTSGGGDNPPPPTTEEPVVAAAAAPMPSPVPDQEPLPYVAADHCPPGSTGPAPLTGGGWWVCVRGSQGAELDGQIIHVTFAEPVVISSVEIVPGAAATTPSGPDEWHKHRVVRVLQYNFCNAGVCVPVVQDTSSGKEGPVPAGPVAKRLERPLLAGGVDVIIQRTDRPSTEPADEAAGSPLESPTVSPGSDPVDYTVAVGALRFFGHPATEPQ